MHPDETIRQIYNIIISKGIFVFCNYYSVTLESDEPGTVKLLHLVDSLFAYWEDENLQRNMNKSFFFFNFWVVISEYIPIFAEYLVKNEAIAIIADLILGN